MKLYFANPGKVECFHSDAEATGEWGGSSSSEVIPKMEEALCLTKVHKERNIGVAHAR